MPSGAGDTASTLSLTADPPSEPAIYMPLPWHHHTAGRHGRYPRRQRQKHGPGCLEFWTVL